MTGIAIPLVVVVWYEWFRMPAQLAAQGTNLRRARLFAIGSAVLAAGAALITALVKGNTAAVAELLSFGIAVAVGAVATWRFERQLDRIASDSGDIPLEGERAAPGFSGSPTGALGPRPRRFHEHLPIQLVLLAVSLYLVITKNESRRAEGGIPLWALAAAIAVGICIGIFDGARDQREARAQWQASRPSGRSA